MLVEPLDSKKRAPVLDVEIKLTETPLENVRVTARVNVVELVVQEASEVL